MPETADVVIIGGGVIGCSIAYHLAKRGCTNVVVLERDVVGNGSTGKCAGGIRQQFSSELNVRLSIESVRAFERFGVEFGIPAPFKQVGYLFLYSDAGKWERAKQYAQMHNALGVPAKLLTPQEAQEIVGALRIDDLIGATFCHTDGIASPHEITQGYLAGARRLGVKVHESQEVTGVAIENGRVAGVETAQGRYNTPIVVNAAGAYAGDLAKLAGIDLPILPYRRHIFVTNPFPDIPNPIPLTVDTNTGFYCHKEVESILMGMSDWNEQPGYSTAVNWNFLDEIVNAALQRIPSLEQAGIMTGWAGLYEVTPDAHPVIGPVLSLPGYYVDAGFSGHGFMHAPIAGQLMAEIILDGTATTVDITPLRFERFAEGGHEPEKHVI